MLITGAAGFLGRHLVDLFTAEGHEITTVVRTTTNTKYLEQKGVKLIVGDLHDPDCIAQAVKGADFVVHAAATLRGRWEDFQAINVEATKQLLESAVKNKVKHFVFISSVIVYDHSHSLPGTRFTEETSYEETEQTYYCKTKIQGETLVNQYREKHGLATTILRPAAIYGKGGPLFLSRLGFAAGGKRYLIVGNGSLPLPLSHVEGIAEAVKLSLEKDEAVGKSYNVVEDETISQKEYFKEVKRQVIPGFSTIRVPYPVLKFMSQTADKILGLAGLTSPLPLSYMRLCAVPFAYSNEKIKKELGWQPRPDLRQSLREMMLWHKQSRRSKRKLPNDNIYVPISSTKRLRVGVVGCGVISGPHLDALRKMRNAEVIAVCDPADEARKSAAEKYGIDKTYHDYKKMLENEKLDAVHICTPAQNHGEIALAAIASGTHVYVEKPFALNAAEAKRMVKAAAEKGVKLCAGHNHIYDKVMVRARNILASGAIGSVCYVESWYGTSYSSDSKSRYLTYEAKDNWAYQTPGSLYQNFISHPISLLLDIMEDADVREVQAKFHRVVPHMPTDELRVTFENSEMVGVVNMSMAVSPRYLFLNIYGTAGALRIDLLNRTVFLDKPSAQLPRVISRSMTAFSQAKTAFAAGVRNLVAGLFGRYNLYQGNETLIRLFYKSILENTPPPIDPQEGVRSMEIMDEIWKQLPAGKPQSAKTAQPAKTQKSATATKTARKRTARKKSTSTNGSAKTKSDKKKVEENRS